MSKIDRNQALFTGKSTIKTVDPKGEASPKEALFFENLPELIKPKALTEVLGISIKTIYDWNYRKSHYKVPKDLFIKINRKVYINKKSLVEWVSLQNPQFF